MSTFGRELRRRQADPANRRWIYVPYDQVTDRIGPLSREDPRELGIVLIENPWKAGLRPYHRQKLALILANLRHFALEQAERGVAVRHVVARGPYAGAVMEAARAIGAPLRMMRAAEWELRMDLQPAVAAGALEVLPHEGWLTTTEQFRASHPKGPPWLLENFYRHARQITGVLMEDGRPVGGRFNFDKENRLPYRKGPPVPAVPVFPVDAIKAEVGELILGSFGRHPGTLDLEALPATARDATVLWEWAKRDCLPHFGPYEDAMSSAHGTLFHTRISALLNICRLLASEVVRDAEELDVPIAGKEGFIRQVLGWREFMHHVHEETEGFRRLPGGRTPVLEGPGDGGFRGWSGEPWEPNEANLACEAAPVQNEANFGGAVISALGAQNALPPAFWGAPSGLHCLDTVVAQVWREGWSHHITRLMVLSNIATLLDVSPRELTDWFWVAYIDAYDWVVEPNVLGLGTFGVGRLFTTKPYVSGANYINRMSDYCRDCRFDPKSNCPLTPMYWAFLERHADVLAENPRVRTLYRSLYQRTPEERRRSSEIYEISAARLSRSQELIP